MSTLAKTNTNRTDMARSYRSNDALKDLQLASKYFSQACILKEGVPCVRGEIEALKIRKSYYKADLEKNEVVMIIIYE